MESESYLVFCFDEIQTQTQTIHRQPNSYKKYKNPSCRIQTDHSTQLNSTQTKLTNWTPLNGFSLQSLLLLEWNPVRKWEKEDGEKAHESTKALFLSHTNYLVEFIPFV